MPNASDKLLIGCGAGFAGDRFDAADAVIEAMASHNGPKYLVFECLAERTLAIAQAEKSENPERGYSQFLDEYIGRHLHHARECGVRIVTNLGAANPIAGARRTIEIASRSGNRDIRVAAVTGDDLLSVARLPDLLSLPWMDGEEYRDREVLSANAYLGAPCIETALDTGADVILVGRTTDSALFLGPILHEFAWDSPDLLATGVICGHLLECGAQVTGSYFADPGFKDVPDLAHVGFPIAEVSSDGDLLITKPEGTGGCVTTATVTEQLLYEMHDPGAYVTPDVISDISEVELGEAGHDLIAVSGVKGRPPPGDLKATVAMDNGWFAEAEMSYAGINALARARLAGEVVEQRLRGAGIDNDIALDIIGEESLFSRGKHRRQRNSQNPDGDYRLRMAIISQDKSKAQALIDEVRSLYCSGPSAGGGFRSHLSRQVSTGSVLVPRTLVEPDVEITVLGANA